MSTKKKRKETFVQSLIKYLKNVPVFPVKPFKPSCPALFPFLNLQQLNDSSVIISSLKTYLVNK